VIRADLDALSDLVARLAAFDRAADELAADLETQVRRLHDQWTGQAAQAHLSAHAQWVTGAVGMRSALRELRTVVVTAHLNYTAAAAANSRMWAASCR
jgi:WXG100 family type VII secretion target